VGSVPDSTEMPQPTPQYEQTVRSAAGAPVRETVSCVG
jgi:hypothetical protein